MLLAGTSAGLVVAILLVAAAVRPPEPAGTPPVTVPSVWTSVATTATSAPPETTVERKPGVKASGVPRAVYTTGRG
ncbi:hypothetical protein CF165_44230 [Amycolatopsis vastitatis]|uniref:Serine/threonine protein kinase n=2 Tax=Amycolatopsis vastitatis TaxID=1905142 RepID=A0A229SMM6_9PSEU|nr:hypothetical protein CF165_44230 [Amycolatopsis vastitatis]